MLKTKQTTRLTPASRKTLLTLLETLPGALFVVDDDERIVYVNASAQTITGATREKVCGKPLWHGAPQLVSTVLYQAVQKTKQTQEPTEVEYVSPVTQTWLHVQLAPTIEGLLLQFHEKRAPASRRETVFPNNHLAAAVLENMPVGIGVLTPEGIVLEINEGSLADAQIRCEVMIGQPFAETPWWSVSPPRQHRLRAAITRARSGETVSFETVVQPREGMELALEVTITPHWDVDHHVSCLVYVGTDITERKQAQAEIYALIDAIPHFVWIMSSDGSCDYCNQQWCAYTSMSAEQLQGDGWIQCLHPDDRQRVLQAWQSAVHTGTRYEVEYRMRQGSTGDYRWFLARGTPSHDAQGTTLHWVGTCTDIEEQKRAEQQLQASEQHWRILAETVPPLVWTTRADGRLDYCNQRYCEYTQVAFEQLQDYGWRQFVHLEDRERTLKLRQQSLETGELYENECRLRDGRTGGYRWFLARALPVRDQTGQITKWVGTGTDIQDKKQAEEDLRALIDAIPQLIWIARPDGLVDYCSQRWCDYTGMTPQQPQGEGWLQAIHPDDQQRVLKLWQRAVQTGRPYEVEHRLRQSTSEAYRWFLARGIPHRDSLGTILKWVGTCTDIEDRKQAEERIKASEQNWRVLAETVPQLVWTASPDGLAEYFSQRWYDYTDSSPEHTLGQGWSLFVHPDDTERTLTVWHQALASGEPYEIEYRLKEGQTGAYRWFLARSRPVRGDTGQIIKWFGTCTDIDEQKRTEEALRQSQKRASVLMNSNIIGIFVDEGQQIVDANDTFLRMTGYSREDLRAGCMNWMRMTPPDYLTGTLKAHQELATWQSMTPYEKEYICKDGSRLPVVVGGVILEHDPVQAINFVLDHSAHKELEQRKDDFIGMASHELRTPLTTLKLQTSLLHRQLAKQGLQDVAPALAKMETQINKITWLVEALLDVSKIQAGGLEYVQEPVDLDALVREITDTLQQTHTSHTIVVRGAVQNSLMADRERLGQVLTNLVSNAIKYSPDATTVEIDLDTSPEMVTIQVHDHGLGIPRELRDKIFERFYRAADPKRKALPGLGMGLYIVAEIIKHHKGTITVESAVEKGSTFTVTLPTRRDA